nr:hypothetical protein [Tanacetum cinerariifolium]
MDGNLENRKKTYKKLRKPNKNGRNRSKTVKIGRRRWKSIGIKSLLDAAWITAVHVRVTAAQLKLVLLMICKENMLSVNAASTKLLLLVQVNDAGVKVKTANTKLLLLKEKTSQRLKDNAAEKMTTA